MENKESENNKNLISIVLPYYNRKNFIIEQLQSILAQTYKNWELILVDDCSTDGSDEIIRKFIEENKDRKIIYKKNERNLGLMKNFEKGLGYVSGEYAAVCDSDDVWFPSKLEKELRFLKKGNFGMVYSDLVVVDENLKIIKKSFIKNFLSVFSNQEDDSFSELIDDNHITAPTILFKSELKHKLIPFSEYVMQDYWIAMICSIFSSIGYLNEPTVYYRQHLENMVGANQFSVSGLLMGSEKILLEKHLNMKKGYLLFLNDLSEVEGISEKFMKIIDQKIKKVTVLVDCLTQLTEKKEISRRYISKLWSLSAFREIMQVLYFRFFS
jgi:glycosyltransferase involved in cell wall biosynthesis